MLFLHPNLPNSLQQKKQKEEKRPEKNVPTVLKKMNLTFIKRKNFLNGAVLILP